MRLQFRDPSLEAACHLKVVPIACGQRGSFAAIACKMSREGNFAAGAAARKGLKAYARLMAQIGDHQGGGEELSRE